MSAQVISDRKRKQVERITGLTIDRLLRLDNYTWDARVPTDAGHMHVYVYPGTWATEQHAGPCWTSCRDYREVRQ